jgi:hypothetical protein
MRETRSLLIATQDVDVWCVAERDNRLVASAAKLAGDKELTGIPSRRLVLPSIFLWHAG